MERRVFLRALTVLPTGLAAGSACAGPAHLTPRRAPGTLSVSLTEAEAAGHALVALPGSSRPILLARAADGAWTALHARCTHRGCQPDPVGERLVCPCHGSEFSLDGEVLEGPADRPLRRFPVRVDGDRLVVTVEETP